MTERKQCRYCPRTFLSRNLEQHEVACAKKTTPVTSVTPSPIDVFSILSLPWKTVLFIFAMVVQILSLIAFLADKMVIFLFGFFQYIPTFFNLLLCYAAYYVFVSV
jgi:hypothetical protein